MKKINYYFRSKLHLSNVNGITLCGREYTEKPDNKRMLVKVEEFKNIDEINCQLCVKFYENSLIPPKEKTKENNIKDLKQIIDICRVCGNEFIRKCKHHKLCSDECRKIYRNRHIEKETRKCIICGEEFTTRVKRKIFCSSKCRVESRKVEKVINQNAIDEKKLRLKNVFDLKNEGKSFREIAELLGVSHSRVQQMLFEYFDINQIEPYSIKSKKIKNKCQACNKYSGEYEFCAKHRGILKRHNKLDLSMDEKIIYLQEFDKIKENKKSENEICFCGRKVIARGFCNNHYHLILTHKRLFESKEDNIEFLKKIKYKPRKNK